MIRLSNRIAHSGKLLIFGVIFTACELVNPSEEVPAYLQIADFQLTTNPLQGNNSEQITDAWVFVTGTSLGIYELPATLPILAQGEQLITIFPVIRENGLRSTPIIYPFYERYEVNLNLEPAQTFPLHPTTTYIEDDIIFELVEDFESESHKLKGLGQNTVRITANPSKVFSGNASGHIPLNDLNEVEFISSTIFLDLPITGNLPVFLEIDYKTTVEFEIGLLGIDPSPTNPVNATNYKVTLCPIDDWNKVYINFQEDLQISQLPSYQLAFRASTRNTGCEQLDGTDREVLIDNIKLIRFQN